MGAIEEIFAGQRWRVVRATATESVPQVWSRVGLMQAVR